MDKYLGTFTRISTEEKEEGKEEEKKEEDLLFK